MSLGPVEYMVIEFPGNQFKGEIIPALREVVDKGVIRIIDLVFMRKDDQGNISVMELADLQKDAADAFAPLAREASTLFAEEDVEKGRVIVRFDSSSLEDQLYQLESDLATLQRAIDDAGQAFSTQNLMLIYDRREINEAIK